MLIDIHAILAECEPRKSVKDDGNRKKLLRGLMAP
jgi:hypothetical protein